MRFFARFLRILSPTLCANTPRGVDGSYNQLPQVVVIMLLRGFSRFRGERFITRCQMAWDGEDGPVAGSDRVLGGTRAVRPAQRN